MRHQRLERYHSSCMRSFNKLVWYLVNRSHGIYHTFKGICVRVWPDPPSLHKTCVTNVHQMKLHTACCNCFRYTVESYELIRRIAPDISAVLKTNLACEKIRPALILWVSTYVGLFESCEQLYPVPSGRLSTKLREPPLGAHIPSFLIELTNVPVFIHPSTHINKKCTTSVHNRSKDDARHLTG